MIRRFVKNSGKQVGRCVGGVWQYCPAETRRLLLNAFQYVLGIGLLAGLICWNWDGFKDALSKPLQVGPLVLGFSVALVGIFLTLVRWYVLVRAQGLQFAFRDALRLGLLGFFFSLFLPGSIGGDVVKAAFLAREQKRRTVAAATALMDRAIGLWGLIWVVAVGGGLAWFLGNAAIVHAPQLQAAIVSAAVIVGVTLSAWLILGLLPEHRSQQFGDWLERIPKVGVAVAELWRAGWMYRRRQLSVGLAVLISLASHTCFAMAFYFAGCTFQGTDIPSLPEHFVFFPIGETIQVLSITPGGTGVAEAGYAALYKWADKSEKTGAFVAFVYRIIMWTWAVVGYFVALRIRSSPQPVEDEPAPELAMAEA